MIELYFWPAGNGKKSVILLEELGLPGYYLALRGIRDMLAAK